MADIKQAQLFGNSPEQLASRYILLQIIGEGQYGKVFKAIHRRSGVIVAMKIISKLNRKRIEIETYREEMRLLQQLDHPHVIQLIEYFETQNDIYIVLEYCKCDLSVYLKRKGGYLKMEEVRVIAQQLVTGLYYLHKNAVLHHDIKLANALVGADNRVKWCDLGLATQLTKDGKPIYVHALKGTPLYMAPEILRKSRYTYRADFWSLGVVIYELYVGKTPFRTDSLADLKHNIMEEDIVWPREIPCQLKSFLCLLLVRNPNERASWRQLKRHPFLLSQETEESAQLQQ
ncbi:Serine/threonine-protein kinase 36 [Coemansia sp. RSA 2611]|nr:Serine/threonine-protein kinase 36 [Coemansia sp. RSA 2708]KAJ2312841.1 Serine/threonine-protein kinase 36 [Coemansia sp. RSA 2705]KAJ2320617.1 Serine/threonine-protein kinase 36 [Coemansia sp. RSA 2704]KAJ2327650.1 Serine/threonine-protein kinase 36 [Coemansia sp. RSA 2702]KAJ2364840.1 Serine/threonine-protein kinase 36 [Coemansia sp. RSA 2610]KAJ2389245.1 Serine/threonine-protein kinase 36 [Coemansia sp. RSA 2611]KAJ2733845.1 Serine/threonine-protein kinase 36 [Coemansia sp. Cherry 401B]